MEITLALFGITREIVGAPTLTLTTAPDQSVGGLLAHLRTTYPALTELRSLAVAVNNEYAHADDRLRPHDEIALIPPVSGG